MKKSLKVFTACFLGAGIGTLTALQINGYFWWIGLLVGMFVGYLSYEFKKVVQAVPKAWNAVKGWKPNKERWKTGWIMFWALASFISTILLAFSFLLLVETAAWVFLAVGFCFLFPLWLVMIVAIVGNMEMKRIEGEREAAKDMFKNLNPIKVYFYYLPKFIILGLLYFFKGTIYIFVRTPKFFRKTIVILWRFIKTLFIMIHSEIRLLCGIDAAIGAAIGYIAGSVLIGAISGGLFGALNYEILSKRILHLVPSKPKNT